ncbi:NAD-dependent epimerase/dehydratase family protein [Ramlibacter ginsenosidimutans]|uniref:NAD-dependent epimerase/dehydratase family protein n=1 Tax=Ramlibacter ginsenosidimutans TaxID=502333 RepID=A0A934TRC0_9BURK|nr:NAD-dependent epimerase/dehydratase family protein [Ramlibacter ginsenosidimutans]MBK6005934.1 NAD-dependent epimerase/dehydratase family protein [Ramlibacter ginsenosidimutans]
MSPKHVLIAGGSGVVGRAALDAFGGAGWEITTLSRDASGPASPRHVSADLLDPGSLAVGAETFKTVTHRVHQIPPRRATALHSIAVCSQAM